MKVVTKKHKRVHHGESQAGIVMHDFLCHFDETFNKSNNEIFSEFFKRNKKISKWMIFSDYALNDKNKTNDVITFSIMPYTNNFTELEDLVNKLSFKDIKSLKRVNSEFLQFINDREIINISILIDKDMKLDPFNEREMLKTCYKTALNQVNAWVKNDGKKRYYVQLQKAYNILLDEASKKGSNIKNIRNIEIVSNLIAYIAFQICQYIKIDIIGWFSDRDNILNHKIAKFSTPVIFDLACNLFHVLMSSKNKDYKEKFVFGLPEQTGKVWYDSLNRIPDLIAATLADYDHINNLCTHDKFIPIIKNVIKNQNKNLVYKIHKLNHGFQAEYLSFPSGETLVNSNASNHKEQV